MPIWEIDSKRRNEILQLIARPLRRCLGLPQKSTSALAVLVECGLLGPHALHMLAAVNFGHNLLMQDGPDPCKKLFVELMNPANVTMRHARTLLQLDWGNRESMRKASIQAQRWQLGEWQSAEKDESQSLL